MNEQEYIKMPWSTEDTIEILKELRELMKGVVLRENLDGKGKEDAEEIEFDFDRAISALEEIQQYREIGTVEECREARELVKQLRNIGYPHNFQHENSWVVDYLYDISELLKKFVFSDSSDSKNEDAPTTSHSEKAILKMCVYLMNEVYENMLEYMDFMGFEYPKNEDYEGYPRFSYCYQKIVQMLFLWETSHSGGTSTLRKCKELGIDDYEVTFEPRKEDWSEEE